jgi:hypothetical protein
MTRVYPGSGIDEPMLPVRFVTPLEQMQGDDPEETTLFRSMGAEAESYISSFPWCQSIEARYFGTGVGKILAVFLFGIRPTHPGVDKWLWVLVGDVPPAYIVTDVSKSPSEALGSYIAEMKRWVELAKKGRSSSAVIAVNVPATPERAMELQGRLEFLERNILPRFREEEIERA